ncbi:MAG TPA: zf-HC2 domain-containing protein [Pyrinomonadaceae bacterium]|jgi:anti-sigma factor RsiW
MRECVQEDVLQAYFDGELSPEQMERVATHIAACAECATVAREIEAESLMMAEAFAPELALSVPTGRLRLRLDASIAELEAEQSRSARKAKDARLRSWLAGLMAPFSFAPQHAMGFASLLAVLAFGALFAFIMLRPAESGLNVARAVKTPALAGYEAGSKEAVRDNPGAVTAKAASTNAASTKQDSVALALNRRTQRPRSLNAGPARRTEPFTPETNTVETSQEVASVRLLPGEKNYLKVIASLDTAIKSSGDNALRPTLRAEYERNLQVVDEAIAQTRVVAQRNPNDKDATEFLLSAYQSKVELMNTMAEQAQLSTIYR